MLRRKFIKDTFTGLPTLMFVPSLLVSSCKSNEEVSYNNKTVSVVVIGAGIAGLSAAKKLKDKGYRVIVLEAQEKIGGRLRTNRSLGVAFDEGASWIHGINGNPIYALAHQAGMITSFTDDDSMVSYDIGGVLRNGLLYEKTEKEFYEILNSMMNNGNANQSFETVFNRLYPNKINDRLWRYLLSTFVTFDTGDLDKLSSRFYNEGEEFDGEERIATNGYDTIPNFLSNGLNIKLNQRVSKIDYSNSTIKIMHNGTETEADYVLVTVPLGVLKANVIKFTPDLPDSKLDAISKIGMSCVNKFLLTWSQVFWDNSQYISYTPEAKDKFNYFVNVNKYNNGSNALMTFAYAEYARQTETMSDAQIIDEIMFHLKDIYGNSIPNPTNLLRTKWQTNENAFGAYSYTAVETGIKHFEALAEEIDSKVFFAGEHTEVDYFSTAHGAYLSGLREADKIIKLNG